MLCDADRLAALEKSPKLLRIFKALYFVTFGSFGVLLPLLPGACTSEALTSLAVKLFNIFIVYFDVRCRYSKYEIGVLSMIPNISAFLVSPCMRPTIDSPHYPP